MKTWFWNGMMAALIALPALSGVAWAGGSDNFGCSNATLKGEYAFGATLHLTNLPTAAGCCRDQGLRRQGQSDPA